MSEELPPRGSDPKPDEKRGGLATEDRIAFGVILGLICLISLGVIWVLRTMLGPMGDAVGAVQAGVGLRDAFLTALPLSFAVIILFALVAGDGLVGELGAMLLGFFVMLIFFTGSIALVL